MNKPFRRVGATGGLPMPLTAKQSLVALLLCTLPAPDFALGDKALAVSAAREKLQGCSCCCSANRGVRDNFDTTPKLMPGAGAPSPLVSLLLHLHLYSP